MTVAEMSSRRFLVKGFFGSLVCMAGLIGLGCRGEVRHAQSTFTASVPITVQKQFLSTLNMFAIDNQFQYTATEIRPDGPHFRIELVRPDCRFVAANPFNDATLFSFGIFFSKNKIETTVFTLERELKERIAKVPNVTVSP
jgi:hypothetical protein